MVKGYVKASTIAILDDIVHVTFKARVDYYVNGFSKSKIYKKYSLHNRELQNNILKVIEHEYWIKFLDGDIKGIPEDRLSVCNMVKHYTNARKGHFIIHKKKILSYEEIIEMERCRSNGMRVSDIAYRFGIDVSGASYYCGRLPEAHATICTEIIDKGLSAAEANALFAKKIHPYTPATVRGFMVKYLLRNGLFLKEVFGDEFSGVFPSNSLRPRLNITDNALKVKLRGVVIVCLETVKKDPYRNKQNNRQIRRDKHNIKKAHDMGLISTYDTAIILDYEGFVKRHRVALHENSMVDSGEMDKPKAMSMVELFNRFKYLVSGGSDRLDVIRTLHIDDGLYEHFLSLLTKGDVNFKSYVDTLEESKKMGGE